jgi:hypothetical protein
MFKALVALSIAVAGCGTVVPSPSARPTTLPSSAAPSMGAVPTESASTALGVCEGSQLRLTPGAAGAAAGTAYLTVFVELAQGPACALPRSPKISVRTEDAAEIASATEADPAPVALTYITRYYIAWSGDCGPIPTGTLVAQIHFSSTLAVDLPIGTFRPSCVDGAGQSISMYADETAR